MSGDHCPLPVRGNGASKTMPHGAQDNGSFRDPNGTTVGEHAVRWPNAAAVLAELAALEAEFKVLLERAGSAAR
jgi:hypothetical protein